MFLIWVSLALEAGEGGWGVFRGTNYSLYGSRSVLRERIFKQNRNISISSRLTEFWCSGLPVALGGGFMGVWGG